MEEEKTRGVLYLCATPIGNLEDITLRALRVLREVAVIAAEDTRQTKKLLDHYGITTPLLSYHEHNERQRAAEVLSLLREGKSVALVTDAGTPLVSDPGLILLQEVIAEGVPVIPVPGPSAALTALMVAGLPTDRFVFEGFLPRKGEKRRHRLEALAVEERTCILYEAPHRLTVTLEDLARFCPGRWLVVARELTKKFEEIWRGTTEEAVAWVKEKTPRGEYTLVLGGAAVPSKGKTVSTDEAVARIQALLAQGKKKAEAVKEVARETGLNRQELYRLV